MDLLSRYAEQGKTEAFKMSGLIRIKAIRGLNTYRKPVLPSTLPLKPEDGTKTSSAGTSKALSVILSGALSLSSVVSTQAQEPTHKLPGLAVVTQPVDKKALSEKVERLIKQIESPDAEKRIIAAQALGKIGPAAEAAVPSLIKALADEAWRVRSSVARALGEIGPAAKAAVPSLINALADENRDVRGFAAAALVGIGPAAVPSLINALADEDENVRSSAALALGLIGPAAKAAIPTLQRSLKDENPRVREAAKTAIEKIQQDIKKHVKKRFF